MRVIALPASALLATVALASLPALPRTAEAGTGVIRCERPDGTRVYTNQACSQFGATSAPLTADLASRIVSERRAEVRSAALRSGIDPRQALAALEANTSLASATPAGPRPPAAGCARTPRQLALDLQASVAVGDVNRVAESFDWAGMQARQANRIMDQLSGLASRSVMDAEYFDTTIGLPVAGAQDAGVMQVTFRGEGGVAIDDFQVTRNSGCYFLRYA